MRISWKAIGCLAALAMAAATGFAAPAAQAEPAGVRMAQAQSAYDASVPPRRPRARVRIHRDTDERGVYPSYNPGPDAVRDCTATYVQEFRPSGTVITPRMNCFWRRG